MDSFFFDGRGITITQHLRFVQMDTITETLKDLVLHSERDNIDKKVQLWMQDKQTLCSMKTFLTAHHLPSLFIDVRHWLIAIVLHIHPESILGSCNISEPEPHHKYTQHMVQCARTLVEWVSNGAEHERKLQTTKNDIMINNTKTKTYYETFCKAFQSWKHMDTMHLLDILTISYINIEDTMQVINLSEGPKLLHNLKQKAHLLGISHNVFHTKIMIKKACRIAKQASFHAKCVCDRLLSETSTHTTKTSSSVHGTIESTLKRAFWDAFVNRLENGHVDQLELIIDEIKHKLNALTPSRIDIHERINNAVDTQLIVQMAKYDCIDQEHFFQWTDFIVSHIRDMQAPQHNTATNTWHTTWKSSVQRSSQTTSRAFAIFLQHVHDDLDTILRNKHFFDSITNTKLNCIQKKHDHQS